MLTLSHFFVSLWEKTIVRDFSYDFSRGAITAILGHNGSGKSSLAFALMGHPRYSVAGEMQFLGQDITSTAPNDRHAMGMFLSFQNIPEIPWIKVSEYLRTIYNAHFARLHPDEKAVSPFIFRRMVEKLLPQIGLDVSFLERDLFVGFSGGEKRRVEILQIELLSPSLIILDEVDSGLDIDALQMLADKIQSWKAQGKSIIIITHNFHLLDTIEADKIVIMKDGQIDRHGEKALVEDIRKNGFK